LEDAWNDGKAVMPRARLLTTAAAAATKVDSTPSGRIRKKKKSRRICPHIYPWHLDYLWLILDRGKEVDPGPTPWRTRTTTTWNNNSTPPRERQRD